MFLSAPDSLTWKEAVTWIEDKTECHFNNFNNLDLLRLKAFDRGFNFFHRCCGQKRLLYSSVLTNRNQRLLSNVAQVISSNYCVHWGLYKGPICSRRSLYRHIANLSVLDDGGFG